MPCFSCQQLLLLPFGLSQVNAAPGGRLASSSWHSFCLGNVCPLIGRNAAPRQDVRRALSQMGLRGLWGWKGLGCCLLGTLLLSFSFSFSPGLRLLLLMEDAQGTWWNPTRHHEGTAAPALPGVDFGSLFSGSALEPHCEPGQTLLILVASAPGNVGPRKVIRNTWAKRPLSPLHPWQAVFLVGQSLDEKAARQVRWEQQEFGDVLLGGYLDAYRNLTLKVLHGLKWATERCRPRFILKTDDDCFVNTNRLPAFLAQYWHGGLLLYAGSVFPREKRRVIRHPASKWYVSREDYPLEEYPPYASGIGYLLSLGAARRILQVAERVPPIPVEDAFVGILAQKAGLRPTTSARFAKQNARWHLCNYRYLMVIHHLNASELQSAAWSMREAQAACSGRSQVTGWK
nr:beta-1,3-galactosyltransferase 5-like isoform X2 [Anolis sagrei ordinatus]